MVISLRDYDATIQPVSRPPNRAAAESVLRLAVPPTSLLGHFRAKFSECMIFSIGNEMHSPANATNSQRATYIFLIGNEFRFCALRIFRPSRFSYSRFGGVHARRRADDTPRPSAVSRPTFRHLPEPPAKSRIVLPEAPDSFPAEIGETQIVKGETQNTLRAELGLARWMARARKMCKKASKEPNADNIHDLRTALRRCLAIESALSECDPHPDWKKVKRAGKKLLKNLGELRDSQVLLDWLGKLEVAKDGLGEALKMSVEQEQKHLKTAVLKALGDFDQQKWKTWEETLAPRAALVAPDSPVSQYIALERWQEGYRRHRFALHSQSRIGYHRLRVGLKNLRYTVENFVPELIARWGGDLKRLQDLLGEAHDLDVLWSKVIRVKPAADRATLTKWKAAIEHERNQRLAQYRSSATGKNSIWQTWRDALPENEKLEEAAVAKFGAWAAFRTPEFASAQRIAARAAELYNVLAAREFAVGLPTERARWIVQAAALMQDSGRSSENHGYHKESYLLIRKQPVPIGWKKAELELTALAARYHRKALPQTKHKEFRRLSASMQHATILLAGILRLANCFEEAAKPIRKLDLDVTLEGLKIRAYGYNGEEPLLSKLANAKHLLEIACRRPIIILPGAAAAPLRVLKPEKKKPEKRTYAA